MHLRYSINCSCFLYFQARRILGPWAFGTHVKPSPGRASWAAGIWARKGEAGISSLFLSQSRRKASNIPNVCPILPVLLFSSPVCLASMFKLLSWIFFQMIHLCLQIEKPGESSWERFHFQGSQEEISIIFTHVFSWLRWSFLWEWMNKGKTKKQGLASGQCLRTETVQLVAGD